MVENEQIKAMRKLGLSEEEITQLLADDKAVDKGEKMPWDLTKEQEKAAKKYASAGTKKPTVYTFDTAKKKRKENPTKAAIIAEIAKFLTEESENACANVEITNKERQIAFQIGENSYELTLVQKRKPK